VQQLVLGRLLARSVELELTGLEVVRPRSHHLHGAPLALLRLHFVPVDQVPDLGHDVHALLELLHSVHLALLESLLDRFVEVLGAERVHDLEVVFSKAGDTYVEEELSIRCPFLANGVLIRQVREDQLVLDHLFVDQSRIHLPELGHLDALDVSGLEELLLPIEDLLQELHRRILVGRQVNAACEKESECVSLQYWVSSL